MPHYLLDGYNVIHALPRLKGVFERDPRSHAARGHLIEMASLLHDLPDTRVTIVFDGQGDSLVTEHPGQADTFSVVYTPADLSADGCIEQMLHRAKNPASLLVVSADNLVREAARSRGAVAVRPEEFAEEVAAREAIRARQLRARRSRSDGDFGNRLPL